MTLYKGNSKIKDRGSFGVYAGSQPIKKIYHGSTLVYEYESYDPDEVVLNITNSTQTITLKRGVYDLCITGGGKYGGLGEVQFTAYVSQEGTSSDYDYYEDVDIYKAFN